jgi:hypothetical protein
MAATRTDIAANLWRLSRYEPTSRRIPRPGDEIWGIPYRAGRHRRRSRGATPISLDILRMSADVETMRAHVVTVRAEIVVDPETFCRCLGTLSQCQEIGDDASSLSGIAGRHRRGSRGVAPMSRAIVRTSARFLSLGADIAADPGTSLRRLGKLQGCLQTR